MIPDEFTHCLRILGLTQAEAAQLLSVNPRTIRRWMDGEEVPVPAEHALRAWMGLHKRGLPWRPDEQSVAGEDDEQIAVIRSHAIDLDALLMRVEARGGPVAPWEVDLDRCRATLGRMQLSFYKLRNGGFALQSYRRSDEVGADPQRDRALLEDAVACIARAFAEHAMPTRTRLSLMWPSLQSGALYLWDTTLTPPVVVKIECQDLRDALGLDPELADEKCRLLVESNRHLVAAIAEELYAQERVQPSGPMGIRVVHLGVPELEPQASAFARGILDMTVRWGTR